MAQTKNKSKPIKIVLLVLFVIVVIYLLVKTFIASSVKYSDNNTGNTNTTGGQNTNGGNTTGSGLVAVDDNAGLQTGGLNNDLYNSCKQSCNSINSPLGSFMNTMLRARCLKECDKLNQSTGFNPNARLSLSNQLTGL